MANALANPLMDDDSGLNNQFVGETYQDVLDWYESSGYGDRNPIEVIGATPNYSYVIADDGRYYNEAGEKVYHFNPPSELGRGGQSSLADADSSAYMTRDEIQSYWDADQGMGYFKQANPDLTFDIYMEFLDQKLDLVLKIQILSSLRCHNQLHQLVLN